MEAGNLRSEGHEHNQALNAEVDRLRTSRQRLETLRWRRLEARDVYGRANASRLQSSLKRWFSHRENRETVQVASIPAGIHDDDVEAQPLDIDSIV